MVSVEDNEDNESMETQIALVQDFINRSSGKDKSNSIENQKELIQRYFSHKESLQNLPVMDFVDDGYTGSNFDRPGFQKMMDGVRSGEIDTIIVKDLSRFGRDYGKYGIGLHRKCLCA